MTEDLTADLGEDEGRSLPGRRVKVTMPDGQEFTARITNRELVLWDKTAPRHKWGKAEDVPFLAESFTTWAAARRDDLTTLTFDAWNDTALTMTGQAEDESDAGRPTRPGPGPGSS